MSRRTVSQYLTVLGYSVGGSLAKTAGAGEASALNMLWLVPAPGNDRFLANIFILRKMRVSFVYHNYSGLLNIGDLLQRS